MPIYTVVGVDPKTREWGSEKAGPMLSYRIVVKDGAGQQTANVELAQKATSAAPVVGGSLDGNLEEGKFGPKFKKEYKQGGFGGGGGGPRPRDPLESAKIQRQHSQDMALSLLAVKYPTGLPDDFDAWKTLRAMADWFDKDIADGAKRSLAANP